MKKIIWKPIPNYPNYMVSNYGEVKSLNFGRSGKEGLLKPSPNRDGYLYVALCKNGKSRTSYIHVLVAVAFLGHVPCGMLRVVDHKNRVRTDNRPENLRIITQQRNADKVGGNAKCKSVGVTIGGKKYDARIRFGDRKVGLGRFNTEKEASDAYQKALLEIESGVFNPKPVHIPKNYSWHKSLKKWASYINIDGKLKHLGLFLTEEEAKKAFQDANEIKNRKC